MSFGDFGLSTMNIPIKENVELHKPCSEKLQSLTTETQINRDNSSMFKGEIDMASVQHKVDRTNVLPFTALVNRFDRYMKRTWLFFLLVKRMMKIMNESHCKKR